LGEDKNKKRVQGTGSLPGFGAAPQGLPVNLGSVQRLDFSEEILYTYINTHIF
jgi:hypothetical protein